MGFEVARQANQRYFTAFPRNSTGHHDDERYLPSASGVLSAVYALWGLVGGR